MSCSIVDLLQGGKVVTVLSVVCGSYGGRVVRRSLLSSKRTAHLDSIPGEVLPSLVHVAPGAFA